jgi:TRAP-type C4-dicarboxylate transport system permease small subunit
MKSGSQQLIRFLRRSKICCLGVEGMQKGHGFFQTLWKIEDMVLISCLGLMGSAIFLQVVTRQLFQTPLIWSEELARYLHVWITFLGLSYGIRHQAHVRVDFFIEKMPEKLQKTVTILTDILIIICFVQFMPGTARFIADQNLIDSSAMGIKMSLVYLVLPLGIINAFVVLIMDIICQVKGLNIRKTA